MKNINKGIMAIIILLTACVLITGNNIYAKENTTKISIKTFKDKNVRKGLLKYDKNKDGYLSTKELKKIKDFSVTPYGQTIDLKGIQQLKYMKRLWIGSSHYARKTKLKNLKYLYKLKNLRILCLDACKNKKINLTSFKKLERLYAHWCKFENIDLRKNKEIRSIDIENCPIVKLNLSHCKKLQNLILSCSKLVTLNLKSNKKLKKLEYRLIKNPISLENNRELTDLSVSDSSMPIIDKNTKLQNLKLFSVDIDSDKLSFNESFTSLNRIDISNIQNIKQINFNGCDKLKTIFLSYLNSEVSVSNCTKLSFFLISDSNVIINNPIQKDLSVIRSTINGTYYDLQEYVRI